MNGFDLGSSTSKGSNESRYLKLSLSITLNYSQGCQMAFFRTKNPNLGKFRKA
jgi:hypothetical protein